ncbi:hypothetical protein BWI15_13075 [Kribbella sp. ALI-6-A]|uniref:hypothetical protein n=1 Tax=Kribbella sp. ALI-6-A TaxID=1933817 RepID=UPI00097BFF1B|nr:hypothetical protein [Kribbella sp. ALI-6-A]ONI74264.1 hypothetical protein BWI15_13075 [Kribbella sp. ALI-6-A]
MTDWTAFTALPWQSEPLHLPGAGAPLSASTAYGAVVAAATPFRDGTRFRALPEVRFHRLSGRVGAPGDLLPGLEDGSLKEYLHRRQAEPFLLRVREPLMLDYSVWSQVRRYIEPLWQQIGVPVVPVASELVVTDGLAQQVSEDGYLTLVWVLHGRLEVETGDVALVGDEGDLLSWPPGAASVRGTECLWLRLLVPVDGKLAARPVTELLLAGLNRRRGTDATPYLPMAEAGRPMKPLVETAAELAELSRSAEVERSLRVQWASRVSAGALEPAPAPQRSELVAGQRVRAVSPVYRMRDGDRWLWAVNGHAFTIGGGDGVLAELQCGEVVARDDAYLPLLRRLHSLRAVEVVA